MTGEDTVDGEDLAYCPKCGSNIPEDAIFCSKCGTTVQASAASQFAPIESGPPPQRSKSPVGAIVAVIVVVVILVIGYLILTSSSISPSPSVRDSDGDGVPDSTDAAPNNPSYWAWGHGSLNVKVTNGEWLSTITYDIYVENTLVKTDTLEPNHWIIWEFGENFLVGATTYHQYTVMVIISGYTLGGTTTHSQTVSLYDGSVATAEFNS